MTTYKDLDIYKLSHRLAVEIHKMALKLPKFEMYEEGAQIRRSSKSISTNIVEGFQDCGIISSSFFYFRKNWKC